MEGSQCVTSVLGVLYGALSARRKNLRLGMLVWMWSHVCEGWQKNIVGIAYEKIELRILGFVRKGVPKLGRPSLSHWFDVTHSPIFLDKRAGHEASPALEAASEKSQSYPVPGPMYGSDRWNEPQNLRLPKTSTRGGSPRSRPSKPSRCRVL